MAAPALDLHLICKYSCCWIQEKWWICVYFILANFIFIAAVNIDAIVVYFWNRFLPWAILQNITSFMQNWPTASDPIVDLSCLYLTVSFGFATSLGETRLPFSEHCLGYTVLFHPSSWLSTASLIYLLQLWNYRSSINFPGSLNLLLWTFCSEFHILYIKFILYPFGNLVSPGSIHLGKFYPAQEQLMTTQSQLLQFHLGLGSMQQLRQIKYGWNYVILLYNKNTDRTSLFGISSSNINLLP